MKNRIALLTTLSVAAALLAACGGGGGGSSTTTSSGTGSTNPASGGTTTSSATAGIPGTLSAETYTTASVNKAMFDTLNQQRTACGFVAYRENSILDQAATNHASYDSLNSVVTDTEVSTNPGYTGVTYADRAVPLGLAATYHTTGGSAGYYTNATLTDTQYGQQLAYEWMSGVYHIALVTWPFTDAGVGSAQTTSGGFPVVSGTISLANAQPIVTNAPLTFPCQGTTGVPYESTGESPTPPNTSGPWGMPIAVTGNPTDTIVLTSGTITSPSNVVTPLQVLDSANDPNILLPTFEGVAYSTSPLAANTTYSVNLVGTYNGSAFTKTFTFTTGNVTG